MNGQIYNFLQKRYVLLLSVRYNQVKGIIFEWDFGCRNIVI